MRHAILATASLLLSASFTACSASGAPSSPPPTTWTATPSIELTPAAASPTPSATPAGPSPSAAATHIPTPASVPAPPKPSGVKFDQQERVSDDESTVEITQKVTWQAPRAAGVEIRVYGVTECIAGPVSPRPETSGPCLVEHTALPESVRTLLATAPASGGVASWTWTQQTGCDIGLANDPDGPRYHAVVLAAYGAAGHSIFAIAEPGEWWEPGPGDVVC